MPQYWIGNWIRKEFKVEASSDEEAWEQGRALFNRHFPSTGAAGRYVYLKRVEPVVGERRIGASPSDPGTGEYEVPVAVGWSGMGWDTPPEEPEGC